MKISRFLIVFFFLFVLVIYGVIWQQRQWTKTTFRERFENVSISIEQHFEDVSITNNTNKSIVIFGATRFFGHKIEEYNYLDGCSKEVQKYCVITSDEQSFANASAAVFHFNDFAELLAHEKDAFFKRRNASILYVLWTLESPVNSKWKNIENYSFNWSLSYDTSSDIYSPYGLIRKRKLPNKSEVEKIWDMKKTSKTGADIVWLVSNCKTPNKRMEIVNKLRNIGLKIDIFGNCGKALDGCSRYSGDMNCANRTISPYKFYISIENSNCKDYVTEKFWRNMQYRFTVPIVLGHAIYADLGIPNSTFIALDDFSTLSEFVKYIKPKIENRHEYLEFHQWRNDYEVLEYSKMPDPNDDFSFCNICKKLHSGENLINKTVPEKWHKVENCKNDIGYKFL